jgi:2,3-bisphosphoglycerate-dependent phosphoglycerate mutase
MDLTFFSPLTKNGLDKSLKISDELVKLEIDSIYSSPYVRTLQTIFPYSKKMSIPVKLDYSLTELYQFDNIPKKSYTITLPDYIAKTFNYDENYKSSIMPSEVEFPEKISNFKKRVKTILNEIIVNNYKTEKNIILVTHQGVIDVIHKLISKSKNKKTDSEIRVDANSTIKEKDEFYYPKGAITRIFENNKWTFEKINW